MKEAVAIFVKRVRELAEHAKGNEQATKSSLIGPLFTLLGYDLTDPRECLPEFRADFGKERSSKPVDWAFLQNGRPIFFVEAKDAGKRLSGYDEQLADYYAKSPEAKLGILTNGIQWRFFTDVVNANVMDREPFIRWDVLSDDSPPYDFLTLLQKSDFNVELIRTFAQRKHAQNLLVQELCRLLEPAPELTKLAVANIETRNLTAAVLESWKPVVANAINEWAKERMLSYVLNNQANLTPSEDRPLPKVETTQQELDVFAEIQKLLGDGKPVEYEDTYSYFKIHLVGQASRAICRLCLNRKRPCILVPLTLPQARELLPDTPLSIYNDQWTSIPFTGLECLQTLPQVLQLSWDYQASRRGRPQENGDSEEEFLEAI